MLLGIWHEKPPPWINLLRNTQYCKWVISDCAAKVFQCNSVSPTELMCKVKIAASLKMDNYRLFKGFWSFPSLWSALTPFKRSCFLCQYVAFRYTGHLVRAQTWVASGFWNWNNDSKRFGFSGWRWGVNWAFLAYPIEACVDWDLGRLEAGSKPWAPCSAVRRPLPSGSDAEIGI